jgi:hypothetical protein
MKKSLHLLLAALLVTTVSACNDDPLFDIPCDAPTADAGVDQTVTEDALGEGADVTLDGSASVPAEEDAIVGWKWTLEDGTVLEGAAQGGVLIVNLPVGEHTITLETTTAAGCSATDTVTITVEAFVEGNTDPTATITEPPVDPVEFFDTETILFEGIGTDAEDGDILGAGLVWTSDVDGEIGDGEVLFVLASDLTLGDHVITLTATDSEGATGTATTNITIIEATSLVSFADDIQTYFVDSGCTGCHGDVNPVAGVSLSSYGGIVYGESPTAEALVVLGDATMGALIPKVEADHNDGADDAAFAIVLAEWIDDYAPNN